jgi:pSer/pThr/pTyr-binding forkhead associated (FHA) protein
MSSAIRFRKSSVPRQQGEVARFKVLQGPDAGSVFVLNGFKATVGRGENNDLVVTDLKSSRVHAEFTADAQGWKVRDLGSANGILHNGRQTREARIKTGDTISLGETTLEFVSSDAGTQLLLAPPKEMQEILSGRSALEAQKEKVQALGRFGGGPRPAARPAAAGSGANRKPLFLIVAGVAVAAFMMLDETPAAKKKAAKKPPQTELTRDLASFLPPEAAARTNRMAEGFFRAGFREYREKNYLRAKMQFENVRQIMPNHPMAKLYLENCEQAIQEEVKFHLEQGRKSQVSGKLKNARAHYEAVMRLLFRDQVNPSFGEARDGLEKVDKELKGTG